MENKFNIKVVIGSWKAYSENGERALGSKWLDLSDYNSLDELNAELKKEGFTDKELEETFIQDIEADDIKFENCDYISKERLREIAEALDEVEDYDIELVKAMNEVIDLGEIIDKINNNELEDNILRSDCETLADYAEAIFNECYDSSKLGEVAYYIDFESWGRDMSYNGNLYETKFGVLEMI